MRSIADGCGVGSANRLPADRDPSSGASRHFLPQGEKGSSSVDIKRYAAFFFALISLRLIRHSAIWTAFSAAPLRRLSDTHHSTRPFSTVGSVRMRLI
ncbi:MAG: hypothetical protein JWR80_7217 [Bradyrhizobium sp.]|nr:hypothetical protein [Bradyrhizobium sp.]